MGKYDDKKKKDGKRGKRKRKKGEFNSQFKIYA